ncbi:hypothetical protein HETIRDRAFT_332054, partial [Heterobasidion irregulare TC 32-1]
YSPLQLGAALQPFPERLFHRVSQLRRSCVMSLTLRTKLHVELLTAFLNARGPRAILSSDSYPLDHSPVVIELLFGTVSVPVASLSLRSTPTPCLTPHSLSLPSPLSIIATTLPGPRRPRPGFVSKACGFWSLVMRQPLLARRRSLLTQGRWQSGRGMLRRLLVRSYFQLRTSSEALRTTPSLFGPH